MSMNEQTGDPASGSAGASDNKAEAIVRRCCKRRQQKLSRLQTVAKTNPQKAKALSRRYFASKSVRIAGAYDAWRRLAPKPIADQVVPYDEIIEAGLALDMWNASEEPVFLRPKERLNGRKRYLPILELREKAHAPLHPCRGLCQRLGIMRPGRQRADQLAPDIRAEKGAGIRGGT